MTSNGKRVAKNSFFQAIAFVAQGATEFIVALVLARLAGPELLGEFTTLIILAGLFAFISAFGLPGLLTRELARLRNDPPEYAAVLNASVGLTIVLSVVAFVLMLGVGVISGYAPVVFRALVLTALALGIESVSLVVAAAFRGIESLDRSSAIGAAMEIGFLVLAIAAVAFTGQVEVLMAGYLASRIIALVVAVWFYQARFGRLRPSFDRARWKALLSQGIPFSVNSVFSFAYSRADVVALSYLAGYAAVGFYEVAYGLTMRMNVLTRAVTLALYPWLSYQFVHDKGSMRAYIAIGIRILHVPGFLIAAILWGFGPNIVHLIYGATFANATDLAVRVLAFLVPLRFLETSLGVSLDASNRAGKRATAVATAAIANLGANILLVPIFGMMGAVYATAITEVLICGLFIGLLRDEIHEIVEWRALAGPVLGTLAVIGGVFLFGGMNIWLQMITCVVLYAIVVIAVDFPTLRTLRRAVLRSGV